MSQNKKEITTASDDHVSNDGNYNTKFINKYVPQDESFFLPYSKKNYETSLIIRIIASYVIVLLLDIIAIVLGILIFIFNGDIKNGVLRASNNSIITISLVYVIVALVESVIFYILVSNFIKIRSQVTNTIFLVFPSLHFIFLILFSNIFIIDKTLSYIVGLLLTYEFFIGVFHTFQRIFKFFAYSPILRSNDNRTVSEIEESKEDLLSVPRRGSFREGYRVFRENRKE